MRRRDDPRGGARRPAPGTVAPRADAAGRAGRGQKSLIGGRLEASPSVQSPAMETILLFQVKECEEFSPALST